MSSFKITGGRRLKGELQPQGAKNEALQILCAVLLTAEPVTIHNIPSIRDVNQLIDLLGDLGVRRTMISDSSIRFEAGDVNTDYMESESFETEGRRPARVGNAARAHAGPVPQRPHPAPGGDKIGRRRLDTHFLGFEKLGAKFSYTQEDGGFYRVMPKT